MEANSCDLNFCCFYGTTLTVPNRDDLPKTNYSESAVSSHNWPLCCTQCYTRIDDVKGLPRHIIHRWLLSTDDIHEVSERLTFCKTRCYQNVFLHARYSLHSSNRLSMFIVRSSKCKVHYRGGWRNASSSRKLLLIMLIIFFTRECEVCYNSYLLYLNTRVGCLELFDSIIKYFVIKRYCHNI